ncbi:hypothetical protein H0H87_005689 [Tephrocybe sp. NHM501043]|nr:hypothetical protein H0H87_005689 [Tephrocybe sp. NHM501043]
MDALNLYDVPISEADGRAMLDGFEIVGPDYIQALGDLALRRAAINALPPMGNKMAFEILGNNLSEVTTITKGFKTAVAAILAVILPLLMLSSVLIEVCRTPKWKNGTSSRIQS